MKRMAKFGPRYGMKRFGEGGATDKKPPPPSSSDDLIPRSMLPDKPPPRPRTKAGRIPLEQIEAMMGETKEGVKLPVKKAKGGKIHSSASRRADGIAKKGKTRGRFV